MEYKTLLGKYRVALDTAGAPVKLHASSAGATYKAQEIDSGREVAVELIPARTFSPSLREELEIEAASARQLNHTNIPAFYDFGWDGDDAVYVTEYLDGTTTEAWVKSHGPMAPSAVLRIALQVLAALGAAAFHKIIHPQINPANLMIVPGQTTEGGWPLIKMLHLVGVAPNPAEVPRGDWARYASPEQLRDNNVDLPSEIYSLGCTLQFLLTGTAPIANPHDPAEAAKVDRAVQRLRGVPKTVRQLVASMVAIDPAKRPHDPIALYEAIQECLTEVEKREALARKFGIVPGRRRPVLVSDQRRRFPARELAVAAALVGLAALATLALPERYGPRQLFGLRHGPVGVPIGVPDDSAATRAGIHPPTTVNSSRAAVPAPSSQTTQVASNSAAGDVPTAVPPPAGELHSTASADDNPTDVAATEQADNQDRTAVQPAAANTEVASNSAPVNNAAAAQPSASAASQVASTDQSSTVGGAGPQSSPSVISSQIEQATPYAGNDVSSAPQGTDVAPPAEGPGTSAKAEVSTGAPVASSQTVSSSANQSSTVASNNAPAAQTGESQLPTDRSGEVASNSTAAQLVQPPQTPPSATENRSVDNSDRTTNAPKVVAKPAAKPKNAAKAAIASKKRGNNKIRVARALPVTGDDEDLPPTPPGTVRARVIGTTPDGRLVLSVPNGGTAVVGQPQHTEDVPAEGPPSRRVRRAIPVPDVVPPPPAQPVFPDDD
jgi:serine/threonine protein kinase